MNHQRQAPSVEQLWGAPELACVAVLEVAIDIAILSVTAVYPEMQDHDPDDQTESLRAALVVLEDARILLASVARFCAGG